MQHAASNENYVNKSLRFSLEIISEKFIVFVTILSRFSGEDLQNCDIFLFVVFLSKNLLQKENLSDRL